MLGSVIEILLFVIIGIIFFLAGTYRWKYPSMRWWVRSKKHKEAINSIIMILYGIMFISGAIMLFVKQVV